MRVSPNCCCSSFFCSSLHLCRLPCLRVSSLNDVQNVLSAPAPVSVVVERKLSDEKVVDEQTVEEDVKVVGNFLKSSLKKPGGPKSERTAKGSVKWMDILGKELVEIKEFDSIDEEVEGYDDKTTCLCIIQ